MREFAVFFENGGWVVMEKHGVIMSLVAACPSFESAVMEVSLRTNAPVGIKLIANPEQ